MAKFIIKYSEQNDIDKYGNMGMFLKHTRALNNFLQTCILKRIKFYVYLKIGQSKLYETTSSHTNLSVTRKWH